MHSPHVFLPVLRLYVCRAGSKSPHINRAYTYACFIGTLELLSAACIQSLCKTTRNIDAFIFRIFRFSQFRRAYRRSISRRALPKASAHSSCAPAARVINRSISPGSRTSVKFSRAIRSTTNSAAMWTLIRPRGARAKINRIWWTIPFTLTNMRRSRAFCRLRI